MPLTSSFQSIPIALNVGRLFPILLSWCKVLDWLIEKEDGVRKETFVSNPRLMVGWQRLGAASRKHSAQEVTFAPLPVALPLDQ